MAFLLDTLFPIDEYVSAAEELYRKLHRWPELSGSERQTADVLAGVLRDASFEVHEQIGGFGLVGLMRNGPGKVLLIRTDMDALPILEETGLPYASSVRAVGLDATEVPVMHACGHDLHMAAWTGLARVLAAQRSLWRGTVVMLAQPAEETLTGARAMLKDGLFDRVPRPDAALAIHVHDQLPVGKVAFTRGPFTASADAVDILIRGRGGHGAYPQHSIDPIVIAARTVLALQTIVSRESSPHEPLVITVGSIHGGSRHNIIPDEVKLELTVRAYSAAARERALSAVHRVVYAEAVAAAAPKPQVAVTPGTCVGHCDPALTSAVVEFVAAALGPDALVEIGPEMGSEDFAEFGELGIPSVMLQVGVAERGAYARAMAGGEPLAPIHSPRFAPHMPEALALALKVEVAAAIGYLGSI